MYKASPNTPETVASKKVTKSTTEKKPSSAKGRNKTTPTKKPRITGPKANTSPQKMQKAEKPRLTGPKANVKVAEKPRLRKKAKASPSAPVMPKTTKPKVKVQDKTAPKKTPANKQVPAGKPRIRGPKAGVTQNKTVPAGKPRIRGPKAGMRQSAPSSQVKTDKTRNAPARAVAAKKRAGMSRGRKTELGLAATGALALGAMMGRDDGKKKSDASPTKPASKPKPKRVTTGTGGNANRTNRTSVTSGATKPRKETEKKKKESRYEKKWGTLRWGDEGELPQVQYRKRKRK
jgi:hypothetical protein